MGCSKAIWFEAFGFSAENWQQLAAALAEHARQQPVVSSMGTPYGAKFIVEGPLPSPDGRDPRVRSVWFVRREEESPRFVTAYRAGGGET